MNKHLMAVVSGILGLLIGAGAAHTLWRSQPPVRGPSPRQSAVAFAVTRPNSRASADPHNPYATRLKLAVVHWPHRYNPADYNLLLIVTTRTTSIQETSTPDTNTLVSGGPFNERAMNRKLTALNVAPLAAFVPENFYRVTGTQPSTVTITADSPMPIPPGDWWIVVMAMRTNTSADAVAWAQVVLPLDQ